MKIKDFKLLLILLFSCCNIIFSQEKEIVFFDKDWKVTDKESAVYYRNLPLEEKGDYVLIKDFYMSGINQMTGWAKKEDEDYYEGEIKWFHENGKLERIVSFKNGLIEGEDNYFYESGIKAKVISFKAGNKEGPYNTYLENGKLINSIIYKNNQIYEGIEVLIESKKGKDLITGVYLLTYKKGEVLTEEVKYKEEGIKLDELTKKENIIAKGYYEKGKRYEGTFINPFYDSYISGEKISRHDNLRKITKLKEGKEEGKQIFKLLNEQGFFSYYHAKNGIVEGESCSIDQSDGKKYFIDYKDGNLYEGETFDKEKNIRVYKKGVHIKTKKKVEELGIDFFEIYDLNDVKIEVEYSIFEIDNKTKQVGVYKNEQPYDGYFLEDIDRIQFPILNYYKKGVKKYQYSLGFNRKAESETFESLEIPFKSTYKNNAIYSGISYNYRNFGKGGVGYIFNKLKKGKIQEVCIWAFAINYGNNLIVKKTKKGFQVQENQNPDLKIIVDKKYISLLYKEQVLDQRERGFNSLTNKMIGYYFENGVLKNSNYWIPLNYWKTIYKKDTDGEFLKNDFIIEFYQKIPSKNSVEETFLNFDTLYYDEVISKNRDMFDNIMHMRYNELGEPVEGVIIKNNKEPSFFDTVLYEDSVLKEIKNKLTEEQVREYVDKISKKYL